MLNDFFCVMMEDDVWLEVLCCFELMVEEVV
ncbi:prophage tail fiber N-terminal domain-containing protein [Klebsiella pneumoniae]